MMTVGKRVECMRASRKIRETDGQDVDETLAKEIDATCSVSQGVRHRLGDGCCPSTSLFFCEMSVDIARTNNGSHVGQRTHSAEPMASLAQRRPLWRIVLMFHCWSLRTHLKRTNSETLRHGRLGNETRSKVATQAAHNMHHHRQDDSCEPNARHHLTNELHLEKVRQLKKWHQSTAANSSADGAPLSPS